MLSHPDSHLQSASAQEREMLRGKLSCKRQNVKHMMSICSGRGFRLTWLSFLALGESKH